LIIAYSPCIAHGYDMKYSLDQQDLALKSGHWNLFTYDPRKVAQGKNPLSLNSKAQQDLEARWQDYDQLEAITYKKED